MSVIRSVIRIRISEQDVHYAGGLVDGAKILQLFGDVATEILIRNDGDEGLFRAYHSIDFLAPVYAGDYLEVSGELLEHGSTSRKIRFEARKVITSIQGQGEFAPSAAMILDEPIIVARAEGTCVVPKESQRYKHEKK